MADQVTCYTLSGLRKSSSFLQKYVPFYVLYPLVIIFYFMVMYNFRYKYNNFFEMAEGFISSDQINL
jgi:hypothetical protein